MFRMAVAVKQAIDDELFGVDVTFHTTAFSDDQGAFDMQLAIDDAIYLNVTFYFEFSANRTPLGDES